MSESRDFSKNNPSLQKKGDFENIQEKLNFGGKKYIADKKGFWYNEKKEKVGHEEECKETYEALSALFEVFSEIKDNSVDVF